MGAVVETPPGAPADSGHVIHELRVENFMGVRFAQVRPDGSLIVVGGDNGAGKSSFLTAIKAAFGGKAALPEEPVRRGARSGHIHVDLGSLVIDLALTQRGVSLEVTENGSPIRAPQTALNKLYSVMSFDVLEFARADNKRQDEMLRRAVGVDFTELDTERKTKFEERTSVNRDAKSLEVQLQAAPPHYADVPTELVSIKDLTVELQRRLAAKRVGEELKAAATKATEAVLIAQTALDESEDQVRELEEELAKARERVTARTNARNEAMLFAKQAEGTAVSYESDDPDETSRALETVEETNRQVTANLARKSLQERYAAKLKEAEELSARIEDIDAEKATRLAGSSFPVKGLAFDEAGPTLNGLGLAQIAHSELLKLSVAIGFALNPELRVLLVRNGESLNPENLQLLAELAAARGGQCWVERFTQSPEGCNIFIVDGEAVEPEGKAAE